MSGWNSLNDGMKLGLNIGRGWTEQARQATLDAQQAQEFAQKQQNWNRENTQHADEDAAYANVQNLRTGISQEQQGQIQQTYGMTPQQTARVGTALPAKLASYDTPDGYDLQNAPDEGTAPEFNASGLKLKKASDAEMERAAEGMYMAKRDMAGVTQSKERQRAYSIREITDTAAKMPLADLEKQLPQLNTNNSQYPVLYTGKGKGGYSFLTTEPDGTPGNAFTMNEAQVRQLASAHALGDAGFGTESLTALASAHKDISDHITKRNDVTAKTVAANNTAVHYGGADERDASRVGIAQGGLALQARSANRQENPLSTKIKDFETAMGRPLTDQERLSVGGLGKEETAEMKALIQVELEGVKLGTATPEQAQARIKAHYAAPKKALNEARIVNALRDAHKTRGSEGSQDGVNKLIKAGYTTDQVHAWTQQAGVDVFPAGGAAPAAGKKSLPSELGRGSAGTTTADSAKAPVAPLQKAYDDWQASKSAEGGWFSQKTPSSQANAERTKSLEQAYTEMLRNQPVTR